MKKTPSKKSKKDNGLKYEISAPIKSLIGVLKLPNDYDFKKDRTEFLVKKTSDIR